MATFKFRLQKTLPSRFSTREKTEPSSESEARSRESESTPASENELQHFQFVGTSTIKAVGNERRKQFRQHLMKDYIHKKIQAPAVSSRRRERPFEWTRQTLQSQGPAATGPMDPRLYPPPPVADGSQSSRGADFPGDSTTAEESDIPMHIPAELLKFLPPGSSPQTFLGAGRVEPFGIYPFEFTPFEHQILDFHHNTLGELMFGHGPKAPLCYLRVSVCEALQDEAILHLVLAFGMLRWAQLRGGDSTTIKHKAFAHKAKGLNLVNERLNDPSKCADDYNIQSALIMTGIEGRSGNVASFKTHWCGVRSMVTFRGGLTQMNRVLAWQLCSAELRLLDKIGIEHMPCCDDTFRIFADNSRLPIASDLASQFGPVDPLALPPQIYLAACVEEFIQVVYQFQQLSDARNSYAVGGSSSARSSYASEECTSVRSTFRAQSPLHTILLPSRFLSNLNENAVAAAIYEQDTIRLCCLFYIHSTLWSYRSESFRTDAYMAGLSSHTIQNNIDRSGSVEGLSWILIWICLNERDEAISDCLSRTRLVLRLMRVARKLSIQTYQNLERNLFDALVGVRSRMPADPGSAASPWVDADRVWQDALARERPKGFVDEWTGDTPGSNVQSTRLHC